MIRLRPAPGQTDRKDDRAGAAQVQEPSKRVSESMRVTTNRIAPKSKSARRGRPKLDGKWPRHIVLKAIEEYVHGGETARAVAARHGVHVSRLRQWVVSAGYPRRPIGRPKRSEPTPEQKGYLRLIGSIPTEKIAAAAHLSRQYVSALARRWPEWVGSQASPESSSFAAGFDTTNGDFRNPASPN
jgi:transposase-like protein